MSLVRTPDTEGGVGTDSGEQRRKWLVLLAVGFGTFMSALDGSIVNTILPVINSAFGTDVATIEWVLTIYLLVVCGSLLTFGRLGDLYGHKKVYVSGFIVFIVASLACSLAPTAGTLVALRGLQAVGASMLFSNSPAILTTAFPSSQRGQALGMLATMTYLGLTFGPFIGGSIAQHLTWRAVFAINVPTGLLALGLSIRCIPHDVLSEDSERFDIPGAMTFLAGMVVLMLALNRGHVWGWGSATTLILFAVSFLLLVSFFVMEARVRHPMLDLSLFRNETFSSATASAILNYAALLSVLFLLPFYLIQGRGLTPVHAGLLLTSYPIVMAIMAPMSGTISDRIGTRIPASVGMAIMATGLLLLSRLGPDSPLINVALLLAVVGVGTGVFISPNTSALMGAAPQHRQGIAAGILATARNVGMVLGVGIAGAIFSTVLAHESSQQPTGALFEAISAAFRLAAAIALLGFLTSSVRLRPPGEPPRVSSTASDAQ